MTLKRRYDLIVVGAGLSGSEAAWAAAKGGLDTLLLSTSLDTVYTLLGDGAVLSPAEGTLMAELHGKLADTRGYVPNWEFHRRAKYTLEHHPRIHLLQSNVSALLTEGNENDKVMGVSTWEGVDRLSDRVALCVGSFLEARLEIGTLTEVAGRLSEMAYDDLYLDLKARGVAFEPVRLEAKPEGGSLPYTVDCQRFAAAEWDGASFRVRRLKGLYAAGVCAAGYLPFEEAAAQGMGLGERLIARQ